MLALSWALMRLFGVRELATVESLARAALRRVTGR
jgi:hypothetical protein